MKTYNYHLTAEKVLLESYKKENSSKSRLLCVAVMLAVSIIFCILSFSYGKLQIDLQKNIRSDGMAASVYIENGTEEMAQQLNSLSYISKIGKQKFAGKLLQQNLKYCDCVVADETGFQKILGPAYTQIIGDYPKEEQDIMLSTKTLEYLGIKEPQVGMKLQLDFYWNDIFHTDGTGQQDFRLSGYFTEYQNPEAVSSVAFISEKKLVKNKITWNPCRILLSTKEKAVSGIQMERKLSEEIQLSEGQRIVSVDSAAYRAIEETMGSYGFALVLCFFLLLCMFLFVSNVLSLSMEKDLQQYGLLETIGVQPKQIVKIMVRQMTEMVLKGSLAGGLIGSFLVLNLLPYILKTRYLERAGEWEGIRLFHPSFLLIGMLPAVITVGIAVFIVKRKLQSLSPLECMNYGSISLKKKEISIPSRKHRSWGHYPETYLARRYLFRNKRAFLITMISLTVGCGFALGASVMARGVDIENRFLKEPDFKISITQEACSTLMETSPDPVEVSYEGQEVQIVHREVTVKETVKKQAFQLIKISEDGEQTETELVEGAGFKVFLISELSGVKDGSLKPGNGSYYTPEDFITYDYSKDETASYWENGKKITVPELFTDKKGYLKSPELPYGTYVVFESTVPENLKGIRPFIVQISEDSREPQVWRVFDDRPLQYYFKIVKKDAQTQKPVLDNSAAYKIYDVEAEKYVEMIVRYPKKEVVSVFRTNEEGYLITPEQLKCGTYRIEEVEAPENYVQVGFENALLKDGKEVPLNEVADGGTYQEAKKAPITITVDSDTVHQVEEETGKFIVVIEQYNDEAVGSLTIHKKGEKLSGASKVEEKFLTKMKNGVAGFVNQVSSFFTGEEVMEKEKGYEFDYEEGNMEGAEFAIHAKETIYTPDGQKDEAGNRIVKYEKDALVARMVTDKEGKAVLNNLPIGKYYVVEEKAGQNCVLDPEAKEFEIAYKGQEVAVDYVTMELTNQRQKVSLSLLKKDAETGKPLEGVVFGLYAQEDIKNAAGEVVVEKDALIELGTTDEEGKLVFQADLPHGKYYIQEVEHKPGYLPNDEVYSFDASYTDQTLELLAFSEEISNQPTITEFTKVDLTGGQEIEGAKMQILDQEGKVVEEWVSKKEAHVVYALAPGEYILHEEQAPTEQGYVRAEDVKFVVEETGDVQKVKMEDDHTKVSISKTDITDGKEIEGAKLQILDQDGEVVESWTTGEEHLIEYLPVGTYTLHEEAAVDGYIVANDVEFTVEETGEIQKVKMEDERAMGQLVIVKTDTDSKAALEGVEFVLLEKETGKEVGRLKTGKDGKAVSELLPIGTYENGVFKEPITYVLKETATLKGYEKTEEEWEIVFTYQNDKTPVIEVVKEIQNKKIPETPGTVKPGPKTGDDTNWFLPLLALGVSAGMVAGLLYYRKRHKKA